MLLLLVVTAAFSLLPGGTAQSYARKFDFSTCTITALGRRFRTAYVNISDDTVDICFDGYNRGTCLKFLVAFSAEASSATTSGEQNVGSIYHKEIPELTGRSTCYSTLNIQNKDKKNIYSLFFRTFGDQGALRANTKGSGLNLILSIDGETINQTSSVASDVYLSISGCYFNGQYYFPETTGCNSDGTFVNCSLASEKNVLTRPNDNCVREVNVCTVTASNVVTFDANYSVSVDDRCAYTLFSESSVQIVGVFKERRRKDVMFLDHMIIHLTDLDEVVQLGPAVRVKVNNTELNLTAWAETHGGMEYSKTDTGVTAVFSYGANYTLTVFFNGYTAQIGTASLWTSAENFTSSRNTSEGLCANSSVTLSDATSPNYSSEGCEMQYSEPADLSIDCADVTTNCQFLNEPSFGSCHADIDPDAYIRACNHTLCHYPDVDGLKCEFYEAYVHACSLKDHKLDNWRMSSDCTGPKAFCQDTLCVGHEFCADGVNGGVSCFCRAIFASNQTLDVLPVCEDNLASVTLVGCLLEEKGVDYRQMHLNSDSCKGMVNDSNHMVTVSFGSQDPCGMLVSANASHVLYENTLVNASGVPEPFKMELSCSQNQPDLMSMTFAMQDNSVVRQMVSGSWNYTLNMTAYTDSAHKHPVKHNMAIQLNQSIYVEILTEGLDANLVALFTNSCWATNGPSPDDGMRYDLISDGCSKSSRLVKVGQNGQGTSSDFRFQLFHFVKGGNEIHLHCQTELCPNQNGKCKPGCGRHSMRRRRRSARSEYVDENPALISMSWTNRDVSVAT